MYVLKITPTDAISSTYGRLDIWPFVRLKSIVYTWKAIEGRAHCSVAFKLASVTTGSLILFASLSLLHRIISCPSKVHSFFPKVWSISNMEVQLYVYDLTHGMAKSMSQQFLGI